MAVFRRKNTRYFSYDFLVGGKRYAGSTKLTVKRDAKLFEERKRQEALKRIAEGSKEELTIWEALDRYLPTIKHQADYEKQKARAGKLKGFVKDMRTKTVKVIHGFPKTKLLHTLTNADLSALVTHRLAEGYAQRTINLELALLQRVHNVAQYDWEVRVNTTLKFSERKFKVKDLAKPLTKQEVAALLTELDPVRDRPGLAGHNRRDPETQRRLQDMYDFTVFLLNSGMRFNEAVAIRWDQIDMDNRVIPFFRSKVDNDGVLVMSDALATMMARRHAEHRSPWVFPNDDNTGPRPYHTCRAIAAAMDRAGINSPDKVKQKGRRTVHSLRDTFATFISSKVPLQVTQKMLGHSTPKQTMKYVDVDRLEAAKKAADALEGITG